MTNSLPWYILLLPLFAAGIGGITGCIFGLNAGIALISTLETRRSHA